MDSLYWKLLNIKHIYICWIFSRLLERITETIDMLLTTLDIVIGEHITEENEALDKPPYRMRGCILTIVERLDEEFTKLLKECDPHSNEYVQRLVIVFT